MHFCWDILSLMGAPDTPKGRSSRRLSSKFGAGGHCQTEPTGNSSRRSPDTWDGGPAGEGGMGGVQSVWERARGSPRGLVGMEIPHWSGLEKDWLRRQEQCPGRRQGQRAGSLQEEAEVFKLEDKAGGTNWDHNKRLGLSWWLAAGRGLQREAAIPPPAFLGTVSDGSKTRACSKGRVPFSTMKHRNGSLQVGAVLTPA